MSYCDITLNVILCVCVCRGGSRDANLMQMSVNKIQCGD
jgi:hypothetical protein